LQTADSTSFSRLPLKASSPSLAPCLKLQGIEPRSPVKITKKTGKQHPALTGWCFLGCNVMQQKRIGQEVLAL
jgi:hypothetical protein